MTDPAGAGGTSAAVDVLIEDDRWSDIALNTDAPVWIAAALVAAGQEALAAEVSLLACDDTRIAALNAEFRGKPAATNVLSWPDQNFPDRPAGAPPPPPVVDASAGDAAAPVFLGDIAIAYETIAREAAEAGKTLKAHSCHMIVHGTLHLLGYDHVRDEDAELMEKVEIVALARLGFANPY